MILKLLQQLKPNALGTINLGLPVIIAAFWCPWLISSIMGTLLCSAIMGAYIWYINYWRTVSTTVALKYAPSQPYKDELEKAINACGMDSEDITLRYGYTNGMIATATLSTITIDPLLFSTIENDPQALAAKDIIVVHILPLLSDAQKELNVRVKEILTPEAQRFIFKHELAHIYYNYSTKKLLIIGAIGMLATCLGIITSSCLLAVNGPLAVLCGLFVAGLSDLLLSYSSNAFFTSREEKNADLFAAHHSAHEETEAAALFFEKLQEIQDSLQEKDTILAKLPSVIVSGHYNGKTRAGYLRKALTHKSLI